MAFHADFWVAAATVSPVIALAHVVNRGTFLRGLDDALNQMAGVTRLIGDAMAAIADKTTREAASDAVKTLHAAESPINRAFKWAPWLERGAWAGLGMTTATLMLSLVALLTGDDMHVAVVVIAVIGLSVALLAASSLVTTPLAHARTHVSSAEHEARRAMAATRITEPPSSG